VEIQLRLNFKKNVKVENTVNAGVKQILRGFPKL